MAENKAHTLSPEEQIGMGSQMNEAKNKARNDSDSEASDGEEGKSMPWMQRLNIRRRVREKAREKIKEKITTPAKMGSARAWQWAWFTLIPSWGLSLIVLDILWFGSLVTDLVVKPGEEWVPKKALSAGGDAGKLAGKAAGIVERMGLVMLNVIAFFIIMAVLVIIVWIADNIFLKVLLTGVEVWEWIVE